jgi:GNAT superfamily N-acetyltransferase
MTLPKKGKSIITTYDYRRTHYRFAKIDSEIVGSGYARIETQTPFESWNYAYLGFMYTDPRHRGKGVNAVIIEALKEWCRSQNITELRLDISWQSLRSSEPMKSRL